MASAPSSRGCQPLCRDLVVQELGITLLAKRRRALLTADDQSASAALKPIPDGKLRPGAPVRLHPTVVLWPISYQWVALDPAGPAHAT